MSATFPVLLDGYTDLPRGKIANVVTFLELRKAPPPSLPVPGLSTRLVPNPGIAWYRALYTRIGQDWLWFSRAVMPDAKLAAILENPDTQTVALERDGEAIGLAELDFSVPDTVEIVTFGVVPEAIGTGAARALMTTVLALSFTSGARRVWLHTCTFDHPNALGFYRRQGFRAYKFAIEVSNDPRATGHLPRTAAPHIPLLD
jgi:ribosomal protein S18 acetylase RimI-like enzyme